MHTNEAKGRQRGLHAQNEWRKIPSEMDCAGTACTHIQHYSADSLYLPVLWRHIIIVRIIAKVIWHFHATTMINGCFHVVGALIFPSLILGYWDTHEKYYYENMVSWGFTTKFNVHQIHVTRCRIHRWYLLCAPRIATVNKQIGGRCQW